ncbi:MAG: bifunctional 4'-phosphopantothenoylcysteine decarboxylase/phosphopantothenoylcysteine synthetase, partial [Myxococcaceae bacterium]|nr:bifunctional 4'-phosphopantothenoylcysteine decarboxylase/phosphopantothenoylcysteine synthetase [Myxococcaceae bacterium]
MTRVVLGVTGCIGAYKACEVLRELQRRGADVHVVMTANATRFVSAMTFEALSRHRVFVDQFAPGPDSDIRHISLADGADAVVVAPATANTLGKFAHGIADDAVSTLYLATTAPVVVAPAMNVNMYRHPAVVANLDTLRARGVRVVEPGSGYLACG